MEKKPFSSSIPLVNKTPTIVESGMLSDSTFNLARKVTDLCIESGLCYAEINIALRGVDEELYKKIIHSTIL